uniref:Ribonuclease 3 n=1 Tax=Magnetococcus massalia (strain MO-1) TaxID=451514 RepID=A0A1S7LCF3_MAGMO|nr:Ribonuclease 3 [Candidatus Magnetococcus massalia]
MTSRESYSEETYLPSLESLEERLNYGFSNPALLQLALTHRSSPLENLVDDGSASLAHNERLEFLGDAVLSLIISRLLYNRFKEAPEGLLSQWRAMLVNTRSLSEVGRELELGSHLRMGRGEAKSGGRNKHSILGNGLEAILGAIYLDGGYEPVNQVVEQLFASRIAAIEPKQQGKDYKTMLQEYLQADSEPLPVYEVRSEEGPPHNRLFSVVCMVKGSPAGDGQGRSKRAAEQVAAQQALKTLGAMDPGLDEDMVDGQ